MLKRSMTGAFNMTQSVLKLMMKAREGAFINMFLVLLVLVNIGQANSMLLLSGLIGFTKSVARVRSLVGI